MSNSFYNHSTYPTPNSPGSSAQMRAELELVSQGFDKLPTLSGNGNKVVVVNAGGTALVATTALQGLTIDNTAIGATTASSGRFTTVTATSASGFFGNLVGNVTGDVTSSGSSTFNNVTISGTLDMQSVTAATVSGLSTPVNSSDAANKGYVDTQNALRLALAGGTMTGNIAMGTNRITGMGDPSSAQDAATKNYIDTLFGSTTAAAASAAAAATSATNASNSATSASTSATNAATSATNASNSYNTFNNQYLGNKTANPTLNNTGGALVAGNLYFNTTVGEMRVWSGSAWLSAYLPASGYLALSGGTMTGAITFAGGQTWPTFNQSTTGNAATATALQTARTINGVSFNGTANITVADATKLPLAGGSMTGNLDFSGTGLRITGDFSNATLASRLAFQTSTLNGSTGVFILPNGTAQQTTIRAYNAADPTNGGFLQMQASNTAASITSFASGTGTTLPLTLNVAGTEVARLTLNNNFLIGTNTDDNVNKLQLVGAARVQAAATQDAVIVAGRAGGTSSFAVTVTPTTLTANRTLTLPDASLTVAGIDVAQTFTATQTLSGSSSTLAAVLTDAAEVTTISATAATGTINYDVTSQSVLFYTTNASANFTVNLRGSAGTTLNALLAVGQSITVAFLVTNGATAFFNNVIQVDGTTSGVTTRWQGGTAPTAGNASSVDVYTYTVIKTAASTFSVFASLTRFA